METGAEGFANTKRIGRGDSVPSTERKKMKAEWQMGSKGSKKRANGNFFPPISPCGLDSSTCDLLPYCVQHTNMMAQRDGDKRELRRKT